MLKPIFTLDYEIHGNGDGSPFDLMVEPTRRMMDQFERYGAKLTIMADVAEILKFRQYKEETGRDDFHYEPIAAQLRDAIRRGHDVQLHLHSSYFQARCANGVWRQDWSEYSFAALPVERLNEIVKIGKDFLESLLGPVCPTYCCNVFRAANWSMSPSQSAVQALIKNGFKIDTSVFKFGRRDGIVSFDYTNADSDLVPWPVNENNICLRNDRGALVEAPIYCERRWLGAFITPNRFYRLLMSRGHPISGPYRGEPSDTGPRLRRVTNILRTTQKLFARHAWKADFNQATGSQLCRALDRAAGRHDPDGRKRLPFVLIGHSKLYTKANERSLEPFLKYVAGRPDLYQFGTFQEL